MLSEAKHLARECTFSLVPLTFPNSQVGLTPSLPRPKVRLWRTSVGTPLCAAQHPQFSIRIPQFSPPPQSSFINNQSLCPSTALLFTCSTPLAKRPSPLPLLVARASSPYLFSRVTFFRSTAILAVPVSPQLCVAGPLLPQPRSTASHPLVARASSPCHPPKSPNSHFPLNTYETLG